MAKTKTLEEQIAEHEAAIKELRDKAAQESINEASRLKDELLEALNAFNDAAARTEGRVHPLRLVIDADRQESGKSGGTRLRLKPEQVELLKTEIVKAVKRYRSEGASKSQIIENLTSPNVGLREGTHFNGGFITRFLAELKEAGDIKQVGDKGSAKYVAG